MIDGSASRGIGASGLRKMIEKQAEPFKGSALKLVKALGPDEAMMSTALKVARRDLDEAERQLIATMRPDRSSR